MRNKINNPLTVCTSQLQQWNKKGGGKHITLELVKEIEVNKTKADESRARSGIKSLLYNARRNTTHNESVSANLRMHCTKMTPIWVSPKLLVDSLFM